MRGYVSEKTEAHAFSRKAVCLFLIFAAVLLAFLLYRVPVKAAEAEEEAEEVESSRSIAIVFDNSGSMFTSTEWCDATYAMEVFAAMAKEGDEIGIYPLNPIEVDEATYTSESPLVVQGGADASMIRDIYTPSSLDTNIEAIEDAYYGLLDMSGEDKWLIVLTGSDIFYENGTALDADEEDTSVTQERLSTMLSGYDDFVNVAYLGICTEETVPTIDGSMYSEVKISAEPADVVEDIIEVSDLIYGRSGTETDSDTLEVDLALDHLVLYVQGDDIENLRLVNVEEEEDVAPLYTCSTLYAEAPGSGSVELSPEYYADNAADTSLSGEIAAYGTIPEGTYRIAYDGASTSVGAHYGPEGSMIFLSEAEGEEAVEVAENASANAERGSGGKHRARFWVLIVILIIVIAAVIAGGVFFMNQKALPRTLLAKVTKFNLNGKSNPDIKKPYLQYSGGGKKTGSITIGPRRGTTDFDFRLTLQLEARSKRFKKSGDRGAVIVSPPTELGCLTSYTIDTGKDKYTFMNGETAATKVKIRLGKKFTYTMEAQAKDEIVSDSEESVTMVVELKFQ